MNCTKLFSRLAIASAWAIAPHGIMVHGFITKNTGSLHRTGVCPSTFCASTILRANRLQEHRALRNKYYALRHGQSQANVARIIASSPDIACSQYGLSPVGKVQARQAGLDVVECYLKLSTDVLPLTGICLLSSDLLRAKETAEAVASAIQNHNESGACVQIPLHKDQVISEARLRERYFGEWDLTSDSNYDNVWNDDAMDPSHTRRGVESVNSVMNRVTECVLDWESRLQNQMVVCIAHGDVLQIMQTCFAKIDGSKHRTLEHLETASLRELTLN